MKLNGILKYKIDPNIQNIKAVSSVCNTSKINDIVSTIAGIPNSITPALLIV